MNLYPVGLAQLLDGSVGWDSSSVRAALLTESYQFSGAHVALDDILASRVIASSAELEDAAEEDGVYSGLPFKFPALLDERSAAQVVVYFDGGSAELSTLIAHWPVGDLIGTPFPLQGFEYFVYPDAELGGFFQVTDEPLTGPTNTYALGEPLALGDLDGGLSIEAPLLVVSGRLSVQDRVCLPADEADSCCKPTFRGSLCE